MNRGRTVFAQVLAFVPFGHFEHLVEGEMRSIERSRQGRCDPAPKRRGVSGAIGREEEASSAMPGRQGWTSSAAGIAQRRSANTRPGRVFK